MLKIYKIGLMIICCLSIHWKGTELRNSLSEIVLLDKSENGK